MYHHEIMGNDRIKKSRPESCFSGLLFARGFGSRAAGGHNPRRADLFVAKTALLC